MSDVMTSQYLMFYIRHLIASIESMHLLLPPLQIQGELSALNKNSDFPSMLVIRTGCNRWKGINKVTHVKLATIVSFSWFWRGSKSSQFRVCGLWQRLHGWWTELGFLQLGRSVILFPHLRPKGHSSEFCSFNKVAGFSETQISL